MTSIPYSTRRALSVNGLTNATIAPQPTDNDVLTYKSASNSWVNQAVATAANANQIDITDTATDFDFYPTFCDGAGLSQTLRCSNSTWVINPNDGKFNFVDTINVDGVGGNGSVNVGASSGISSTDANRVAVGNLAGNTSQLENATAVGNEAGQINQGVNAVAVGNLAGNANQSASGSGGAIAIGNGAGQEDQSSAAVALGQNAGNSRQGRNSIAIGNNAATTTQRDNQININASGVATQGVQSNACYITELRGVPLGIGVGVVYYNSLVSAIGSRDNELVYSTT